MTAFFCVALAHPENSSATAARSMATQFFMRLMRKDRPVNVETMLMTAPMWFIVCD